MAAFDLTRNDPGHQASVLYGLDPGEGDALRVGGARSRADHLPVQPGTG